MNISGGWDLSQYFIKLRLEIIAVIVLQNIGVRDIDVWWAGDSPSILVGVGSFRTHRLGCRIGLQVVYLLCWRDRWNVGVLWVVFYNSFTSLVRD